MWNKYLRRARNVIVTAGAVIATGTLAAETPTVHANGKELYAIMERAESRSETMRAKLTAVRSGEAKLEQAVTWQNPTVEAAFGRRTSEGTSGAAGELRILQPFFLPGKSDKRRAVFAAAIDRSRSEAEEFRLFTRYEAARLAYAYAAAEDIAGHLKERVMRMRLLSVYLQGRPFAAPQKIAQKRIVERKLERIEKTLRDAALAKESLWFQLNLYLDYPEPVPIRVPWFGKGPELAHGEVLALAMSGNTELQRKRIGVREREAELALAQAEAYPDLALSATYRNGGGAGGERYYGAGITIPLPIFNRNQHATRASELGLEASREELNFETRRVQRQIEERYASYAASRVNLAAFPVTRLQQIDLEMDGIEAEFRRGRVDFPTFIEAESETFEGHLLVYGAQIEFAQNYAALLMTAFSRDFRVE